MEKLEFCYKFATVPDKKVNFCTINDVFYWKLIFSMSAYTLTAAFHGYAMMNSKGGDDGDVLFNIRCVDPVRIN